jgi:hypothetical protein
MGVENRGDEGECKGQKRRAAEVPAFGLDFTPPASTVVSLWVSERDAAGSRRGTHPRVKAIALSHRRNTDCETTEDGNGGRAGEEEVDSPGVDGGWTRETLKSRKGAAGLIVGELMVAGQQTSCCPALPGVLVGETAIIPTKAR